MKVSGCSQSTLDDLALFKKVQLKSSKLLLTAIENAGKNENDRGSTVKVNRFVLRV